jgi:hypothetical protein
LSNISCESSAGRRIGSILSGIPGHPIEDVKISDVIVLHQGGGTKEDADREVPEKEKNYPEPDMFGMTPSHGFFIRHVRGLEMSGIKIESASADARPAFVLDDVEGADFGKIKIPAGPAFALSHVKDFSVYRSRPLADAELADVEKKEI